MRKEIIIFIIFLVFAGILYVCKDAFITAVEIFKPVNKEFSEEIQSNLEKEESLNEYELLKEQEKKEVAFTENQLKTVLDMKNLDEIIKTARKDNKEELEKMQAMMREKEQEKIAAQKEIIIKSNSKK